MGEQWYQQEWIISLRWFELVTAGEFLVPIKKLLTQLNPNFSQWYSTQVFVNFLSLRQRQDLKPLEWVIIWGCGTALFLHFDKGERYNCLGNYQYNCRHSATADSRLALTEFSIPFKFLLSPVSFHIQRSSRCVVASYNKAH